MKIYLNCEDKNKTLSDIQLEIEKCGIVVNSLSIYKLKEDNSINWLDDEDKIIEADVSSNFFSEEGIHNILHKLLPDYEKINYDEW